MINTKKNRETLYLKLSELDIVTKIRKAIKDRPEFNVPWVYTKYLYEARCNQYHEVFHQQLGRIHSFCRSCWKVVIRPQNLVQLFDLYEFQRELAEPCKCGYEARETVYGIWGGYFYNRSKEEAQERFQEVSAFADTLNPRPPVIIKRYCTEFEIGPQSLGPSNELPEQTKKEIEEETQIDNFLFRGNPQFGSVQADFLQAHVMRRWIHWAYQHGDETYKAFTGGNPLFPKYVTYHEELAHENPASVKGAVAVRRVDQRYWHK
jgi:hypothetical protein